MVRPITQSLQFLWLCYELVVMLEPLTLGSNSVSEELHIHNQSFFDRLQQNIATLRLEIQKNVPGDGNCFQPFAGEIDT